MQEFLYLPRLLLFVFGCGNLFKSLFWFCARHGKSPCFSDVGFLSLVSPAYPLLFLPCVDEADFLVCAFWYGKHFEACSDVLKILSEQEYFECYPALLILNLCGFWDLSTLTIPSFASRSNSFLTKPCGSLIAWAMPLMVMCPSFISSSRVIVISFFSALSRRSFSIEDSMWCFAFRSISFW